MTAIAAIASQVSGRVFMGGDSAVTSGWELSGRPDGWRGARVYSVSVAHENKNTDIPRHTVVDE